MIATANPPVAAWTAELEHSEALDAVLAVAMSMHGLSASLGPLLQFHVVIDTNIIVEDLIYLIKTQGQEHRRPAVYELVSKKALIAYFPMEKLEEVEAKCSAISKRYGFELELLRGLWAKYRERLHIVPTLNLERERPDSLKLASRDPSDVPFVQARHIVGASVVISKDDDIMDSGAPVIPRSQVLIDLRHYSRKQGLQAAVLLGGGTVVLVPIGALIGCIRLIHHACKTIPRNALIAIAAALGVALLIPQSRAFLIRTGRAAWRGIKEIGSAAGPVLSDLSTASAQAKVQSEAMRPKLDEELARVLGGYRVSLSQACYRALVVARRPLTVGEIWAAAARDGATTRARDPLKSVLATLKRSRLLVALPDGRWALAPTANAP